MKSLSIYLITILTTLMVSCGAVPISEAPALNNSTYTVSYLFEHEGIKVYRFQDSGRYVYFTNCGGEITSITNDSVQVRTQTIR